MKSASGMKSEVLDNSKEKVVYSEGDTDYDENKKNLNFLTKIERD
jgi:hypothetical protein